MKFKHGFGARLREIRYHNRLSTTDLAQITDHVLTQDEIERLERETMTSTVSQLLVLRIMLNQVRTANCEKKEKS